MTIEDQIKEVKRELALRKSVYPGLIKTGKLTRDQANRQYLAMEAVLETLWAYDDLHKGLEKALDSFNKLNFDYDMK